MFFKKQPKKEHATSSESAQGDGASSPLLKSIPGGASGNVVGGISPKSSASSDDGLGMVLDALGGVLSALSRYPLDLPNRSAEESGRELGAWQRHATMGLPVDPDDDQPAVSLVERNWGGVVRTVTQVRRDEHHHVHTAISELREALWACVETVHRAVRVDSSTDATAETQMERAKSAITHLQTGSIKKEVLGAVGAIESALQVRREHHQEQYASLASRLEKLGRQLEDARKESTTDPLTGVGNRKLFDIMAPRAIQLHSLSKAPMVLLMIDLDKLKYVNDMFGHQSGDAFIAGVAKCLSKVFMRHSDVVTRYGGDEFAVILHNTDARVAESLGQRLLEQVGVMTAPHPGMEYQVGASVGIAELQLGEELEEWMARADKALYKAKASGTVRVLVG